VALSGFTQRRGKTKKPVCLDQFAELDIHNFTYFYLGLIRYFCRLPPDGGIIIFYTKGGKPMVIVIFIGILVGFLLGFSSMALLAARSYRLNCQELEKVPVYPRATPQQSVKRWPHDRASEVEPSPQPLSV
jgi:hypothetical protein